KKVWLILSEAADREIWPKTAFGIAAESKPYLGLFVRRGSCRELARGARTAIRRYKAVEIMSIAGEVCRGKLNREVGSSACGASAGLYNVGERGIGSDLSLQFDRGATVFGASPQDHFAGGRIARRHTIE